MARRRPHVLLTLSPDAIRRLDELVAAVRADGQRCSRSSLVEWLVLGLEETGQGRARQRAGNAVGDERVLGLETHESGAG